MKALSHRLNDLLDIRERRTDIAERRYLCAKRVTEHANEELNAAQVALTGNGHAMVQAEAEALARMTAGRLGVIDLQKEANRRQAIRARRVDLAARYTERESKVGEARVAQEQARHAWARSRIRGEKIKIVKALYARRSET